MRVHLLALVVAIAACNAAPKPSANAPGLAITFDTVPILVLSTENEALDLLDISDATRLSNGVVAIADAFGDAVHLISSDGRLKATVGRSGGGPGEFRSPGWIEQCRTDSLFVWDRLREMMVVFGINGHVAREFRLAGRPFLIACNRTGTIISMSSPAPDPRVSGDYPPLFADMLRSDLDGDSVAMLGRRRAGESRPLGTMSVFALDATAMMFGTSDTTVIEVYDLGRGRARPYLVDAKRELASDINYDAAIAKLMDQMPRSNRDDEIRAVMRAVPRPKHAPAYRSVVADQHGLFWVTTSPYGATNTRIVAIDATDGKQVAEWVLRPDTDLLEVGTDYALSKYLTSDGIEHLVVSRIDRDGHGNE
ncbi:MAG: hypothetical protein H0W15_07600 [Gemmatimonadales bacterium]|nr:hypothetical protein [Gemmatimonadales bacterium]